MAYRGYAFRKLNSVGLCCSHSQNRSSKISFLICKLYKLLITAHLVKVQWKKRTVEVNYSWMLSQPAVTLTLNIIILNCTRTSSRELPLSMISFISVILDNLCTKTKPRVMICYSANFLMLCSEMHIIHFWELNNHVCTYKVHMNTLNTYTHTEERN